MKNAIQKTILVLLAALLLAGCAAPSPSAPASPPPADGSGPSSTGGPVVVNEGESVRLVRAMMELDYPAMTVAAFNEAIQKLCEDAGTNVFAVVADAYDHFGVYDEDGIFLGTQFNDDALQGFMQTTLEYSAQEIFGEPAHLGSVMYLTMPGRTAVQMDEEKAGMTPAEWDAFFAENVHQIEIFPILSYVIEADTPDPGALTVAQRDGRLNTVHAAIKACLLGLDKEQAAAETLWDSLEAEFERLSAEYSDGDMAVACRIQGLERDIG